MGQDFMDIQEGISVEPSFLISETGGEGAENPIAR